MDILIKGMEMPKSCIDCPCMVSDCEGDMCAFQSYEKNATFADWDDMKKSCPLIPVPPHGRLIDADALIKSDRMVGKLMMYGGEYVYTQAEIDRAPTIIEAEEGE